MWGEWGRVGDGFLSSVGFCIIVFLCGVVYSRSYIIYE